MYDIIIIGAGCAGLTAAIYAAREGKSVLVLEAETIGGQISFSPKVENYPGIKSISGSEFSDNLYEQALSFGVEIELERVTEVIDGEVKTVITENKQYKCKSIIIATGVKHKKLGLEKEDELLGKGVSYCATCDGAFYKDQNVAVIGGGSVAMQYAISLSAICKKVYLIHRRDEFRGEKVLLDTIKGKKNIELKLSSEVTRLNGSGILTSVIIKDNKTGTEKTLDIDGLFISIGYIPENDIFKGVVGLDEYGYIKSGEDCKTTAKGIFAAGDCRYKPIRQLTTAAADGTVAAMAACKYVDEIK